MRLTDQPCIDVCDKHAAGLTAHELDEVLKQLPQWSLIEDNRVRKLVRVFSFGDFAQATAFTVQVALLAEKYNHHPYVALQWGKVEVQWWTHAINGLHKNDAVLAAKTQSLYD